MNKCGFDTKGGF